MVRSEKGSQRAAFLNECRDDWIRTSDLLHPMQTRYRAALRPELYNCLTLSVFQLRGGKSTPKFDFTKMK